MLDNLLALLTPHSCSGCGNLGSILCQSCKNDIIFELPSDCLVCQHPTVSGNFCKQCKAQGRIEAAWYVGIREKALKTLLNRYKFDSAVQASGLLAELLDVCLPQLPENVTIVPVPTSPGRIRTRGFDHTARIVKRLGKLRHLRVAYPLRRRTSDIQHFKSRAERLKFASSAFESEGVAPGTVLLIDDIYTTGATIHACAEMLYIAGAQHVYVAVIARQTLD